MEEEQRLSTRHDIRFKLIYDDGESFNTGIVHNLSESGLFLETVVPLNKGDVVQLISLDVEEELYFELRARVIRIVEPSRESADSLPGMAFQFEAVSQEQQKRLKALIKRLQEAMNSFYGTHDLFFGKTIPDEHLKRSASGIWRVPPASDSATVSPKPFKATLSRDSESTNTRDSENITHGDFDENPS
ncbi:MAG: PilZ domain-containing protein [Myxococcales bacterium]|nr:PilZ domain-containing protein [Myxococcales bacterium]